METEGKSSIAEEITSGAEIKAVSVMKCKRCGHEWLPRRLGVLPLVCPRCHSAYHQKDRIRVFKKKGIHNKG